MNPKVDDKLIDTCEVATDVAREQAWRAGYDDHQAGSNTHWLDYYGTPNHADYDRGYTAAMFDGMGRVTPRLVLVVSSQGRRYQARHRKSVTA